MNFQDCVRYLESLQIMPKTMPGLQKLQKALNEKTWFNHIDPKKVIIVAGTNGKGTTSAALEALLISANKKVGLYTSPHLVSTTERLRIQSVDISVAEFVELFKANKQLIEKYQLTHFESLTLLAGEWFFDRTEELDYIIFEVGLGGTYDATNVFPHHWSVITKLGLDHQNILGQDLLEIAKNKFGIVKDQNCVVHQPFPDSHLEKIQILKNEIVLATKSDWFEAQKIKTQITCQNNEPLWTADSPWGLIQTNLKGDRALENIFAALTLFEKMGFSPQKHLHALLQIKWSGRMSLLPQVSQIWPAIQCPVYLSGDHNPQGIESLIEILKKFKYQNLHLVIGVGAEKDFTLMFQQLLELRSLKIYLTETPFKGCAIENYPDFVKSISAGKNKDVSKLLSQIQALPEDLVVITGSLYLVGHVMEVALKAAFTPENQI